MEIRSQILISAKARKLQKQSAGSGTIDPYMNVVNLMSSRAARPHVPPPWYTSRRHWCAREATDSLYGDGIVPVIVKVRDMKVRFPVSQPFMKNTRPDAER